VVAIGLHRKRTAQNLNAAGLKVPGPGDQPDTASGKLKQARDAIANPLHRHEQNIQHAVIGRGGLARVQPQRVLGHIGHHEPAGLIRDYSLAVNTQSELGRPPAR